MHRRLALAVVVAVLVLPTSSAVAHGPSQPPHQQYRIGGLALESGETMSSPRFLIRDMVTLQPTTWAPHPG